MLVSSEIIQFTFDSYLKQCELSESVYSEGSREDPFVRYKVIFSGRRGSFWEHHKNITKVDLLSRLGIHPGVIMNAPSAGLHPQTPDHPSSLPQRSPFAIQELLGLNSSGNNDSSQSRGSPDQRAVGGNSNSSNDSPPRHPGFLGGQNPGAGAATVGHAGFGAQFGHQGFGHPQDMTSCMSSRMYAAAAAAFFQPPPPTGNLGSAAFHPAVSSAMLVLDHSFRNSSAAIDHSVTSESIFPLHTTNAPLHSHSLNYFQKVQLSQFLSIILRKLTVNIQLFTYVTSSYYFFFESRQIIIVIQLL